MALKRGGPVTALPDETPEVPGDVPRDRWDRPLIVPPGGGRVVAYTRASTLGKTIEDEYHLSKWGQRNVALGLSRRPDLVALAAAVRTNEGDDRAALDDIAERAHEAAKGDRGANVGTALHKLSERRDAGEDLSHLPVELAAALDAYSRIMEPFDVLASETFVVHDDLQAAGTFDRMLMPREGVELVAPDGTRFRHGDVIVVDLKTGRAESAKYWGAGYAVQQAVYAHGLPYRPGPGRTRWEAVTGAGEPSSTWALILHVPSDSPADAGLVWVDLEIGAALAELCVEVRRARRVKGLFAECHVTTAAQAVEPAVERPNYCAKGCGDDSPHLVGRCAPPVPGVQCTTCGATAPWPNGTSDGLTWAVQHSRETGHPDEYRNITLTLPAEPSPPTVPGGNTKPVPGVVARLDLVAALHRAPDEAALDALWQQHQDVWTDAATQMVKAKLREFDAAAVTP